MEKQNTKKPCLNMKSIFRCMMEDGYTPSFEDTHIQFDIDDNIGVLEYDEDILSVHLFFSIDEESYELFLEASNLTMLETYAVKPVVLEDMKNIMFSCETISEFRKFLPRAIERLKEALCTHKSKMKRLVLASELLAKTVPATEETVTGTNRKLLS